MKKKQKSGKPSKKSLYREMLQIIFLFQLHEVLLCWLISLVLYVDSILMTHPYEEKKSEHTHTAMAVLLTAVGDTVIFTSLFYNGASGMSARISHNLQFTADSHHLSMFGLLFCFIVMNILSTYEPNTLNKIKAWIISPFPASLTHILFRNSYGCSKNILKGKQFSCRNIFA